MSRFNLTLLIGSLLVGFAFGVTAQDKPTKSNLPSLAIEVVDREHEHLSPFPVFGPPSEGGYAEIGPPPKRPEWKQLKDTAPLTRVRIRSTLESDGVRIKIGAVFDDSEPIDAPGPKYGEKEQIIASYFARLGDTVTVNELEHLGFEALVLRVVKYKPPPVAESAPAILPEVVNDLKSVAFIDLQNEKSSAHFYRLTLQNLAGRSIVALAVRIAPSETQSTEGTREKPIITPGATFQTPISVADAPENSRPTVVIQTVLFDDGTYEGNVVTAAEMAARTRGRQIQLSRVLRLLQEAPDQPDAVTAIQELKAGVTELRIDVDLSVIEELRSQFPALPGENGKAWLASKVMEGLKNGRGHALYLLNDIEQQRLRNPADFDLGRSLAALRERVANLAGNQ